MSQNYKLQTGNHIKIDKTDEGYEYSLYEECKKLIDGGILENPNLDEKEALKEVFKMFDIPVNIEYKELDEEIEETGN